MEALGSHRKRKPSAKRSRSVSGSGATQQVQASSGIVLPPRPQPKEPQQSNGHATQHAQATLAAGIAFSGAPVIHVRPSPIVRDSVPLASAAAPPVWRPTKAPVAAGGASTKPQLQASQLPAVAESESAVANADHAAGEQQAGAESGKSGGQGKSRSRKRVRIAA